MNKSSPSDEIAIFVRVVERGSFTTVAEETGLTPSGVSKVVTRLEDRLGVRLLQRTTRRLALTPEGETLLSRGREILLAIEAMESEVTAARGKPRGLVRVNTGSAFAKHKLIPALPDFRARFPEIEIELGIDDRRIDVIAQQVDVAIRSGPLGDSQLVARKIGEARRVVCASRAYVKRHGKPRSPEDLARHSCLVLAGHARLAEWPMRIGSAVSPVRVKAWMTCDSADVLLDLVRAGLGIARLSSFLMEDALASGAIVSLLTDHHVPEPVPSTALMPPGRQHLPRVRAFVDFLVERCG
jgi:DNA-binding transcriptional LysR family regulator